LVNNYDWFKDFSFLGFLRDVGKHLTVNYMMAKDSVKRRISGSADSGSDGISYTEFSYQLLQGMDFLELYRQYGCVLQTGGSDQWGNLTSGTDLIHRVERATVHAIGTPLITNSDGTKFGKSEGNAVWLDPSMTSPYAFYQFWVNTDDADVIARLKVFTFLDRVEIERLAVATEAEPFKREAQKTLAYAVTALVHGVAATDAAIAASAALFGQGDLDALDADTLRSAVTELPNARVAAETLVIQALVDTELCSSLGEARRAVAQGGVSVNNRKIDDVDATLDDRFLTGGVAVLRRGKRTLAGLFLDGAPA
jgi:tyrosyl-tRNA synthetase